MNLQETFTRKRPMMPIASQPDVLTTRYSQLSTDTTGLLRVNLRLTRDNQRNVSTDLLRRVLKVPSTAELSDSQGTVSLTIVERKFR